jgi:hypothetical protein
VSTDTLVREALQRLLQEPLLAPVAVEKRPKRSSYGVLAKYGPAPSAEEIDENRRDMFRNFARDDGEW